MSKIENTELGITFNTEDRESWEAYLDDFDTFVWPILSSRGYTKDIALIVWMLNKLSNDIHCITPDDG